MLLLLLMIQGPLSLRTTFLVLAAIITDLDDHGGFLKELSLLPLLTLAAARVFF